MHEVKYKDILKNSRFTVLSDAIVPFLLLTPKPNKQERLDRPEKAQAQRLGRPEKAQAQRLGRPEKAQAQQLDRQ
jgi:hypothetical protein